MKMNSLLSIPELDFYLLDFLNITSLKKYLILTKATLAIFMDSPYYLEFTLYYQAHSSLQMEKIFQSGHLAILKIYLREYPQFIQSGLVEESIKYGHLQMVKYLDSIGLDMQYDDNGPMRTAVKYGHLDIVEYLSSRGVDIHGKGYRNLRLAAENGRLEIVKYLTSRGADTSANYSEVIRMASRKGYVEIVQYLLSISRQFVIDRRYAMNFAAFGDRPNVMKFLITMGENPANNQILLVQAMKNGYNNINDYLNGV